MAERCSNIAQEKGRDELNGQAEKSIAVDFV